MHGDRYTLLIFTSSPTSRPSSEERLCVVDPTDAAHNVAFTLNMARHPGLVHMWLFVTNQHPMLGIDQTTLLGWGSTEFDTLTDSRRRGVRGIDLILVDVSGVKQGVITVSVDTPVTPPFDRRDRTMVPTMVSVKTAMTILYARIRDRIVASYDHLRRDLGLKAPEPDRSNFYYVQTHMEKMPITSFAYLSTLVNPLGAADLLRILHRRAEAEVRILEDLLHPSSSPYTDHRRSGETLIAMCTMLVRAMLYTEDTRRTADSGPASTDQWVQLGTFPSLAMAAFDCEDGAGLVLSLIYLLRVTRFDHRVDANLVHIQEFANRYTPFFVLGNLRIGTGSDAERDYTSHAYVVMLDRRWFADQLSSSSSSQSRRDYLPALSFESTANITGVWDRDAMAPIVKQPFDTIVSAYTEVRRALAHAFDSIDRPDIWQAARQTTPLQSLNHRSNNEKVTRHRGAYEDVYVLMAVDHASDRVVHCIATDTKRRSIGVLAEHLLTYASEVRLEVVFNVSRSEFEETYQCLWKQEPINRLPNAIDDLHAPVAPPAHDSTTIGIVDLSTTIFKRNQRAIESAMQWMEEHAGYKAKIQSPPPPQSPTANHGSFQLTRLYISRHRVDRNR